MTSYPTNDNPFEEAPDFEMEEVLSVSHPYLSFGRWGFGPTRKVDVRIRVMSDLSFTATQIDNGLPAGPFLLHNKHVVTALSRLIKQVRREKSRRITRTQRRTDHHLRPDTRRERKMTASVPHPDVVREQEWLRIETLRRQALLNQQVQASEQISMLRQEQQTTRIFRRNSESYPMHQQLDLVGSGEPVTGIKSGLL